MKRFLVFIPLSLLTLGWATLAGCSLPSISPEQRAYTLVAGLNAVSRDVLADIFLPTIADMAALRDPLQYPAIWEVPFPYDSSPYSVTALDASDPAAATLTIQDSQGGAPLDILLVMARLGNDWFALRLESPAGTVIVN